MRLFLAVLTVGAAGIGYAYVHQSDLHSAETPAPHGSLFDWQSANDPVSIATEGIPADPSETPLVVRETISRARSEITSTIDEFVRVNLQPDSASSPTGIPPQDITTQDDVSQTQYTVGDEPAAPEVAPAVPVDDGSGQDDLGIGPVIADPAADAIERRPELTQQANDCPVSPATAEQPVSKPAINEATLRTKKSDTPDAGKSGSTSNPPQSSSTRSTTELLPGRLPDREKKVIDSGWTSVARTTKELPMHTRHFGREGTRTLVIAGLDGQDLIAVRWNDQLADVLARQSDLFPVNEVQVFRAGNPDGLMKISSTNARGVLINRNFPSRRYQLLTDKSSGPGPVSEAETRAILDVLYTFRPRRVIHLMSTGGPSKVFYNRAAKEIATELQQEHKLEIQPLDVELVPGSLEDFSDGTLDAAVITMQLSGGSEWQKAWKQHLPSVLAAINGRSLAKMRAVSNDGTRIPDPEGTAVPVPKIRRGYEELPPPPQ